MESKQNPYKKKIGKLTKKLAILQRKFDYCNDERETILNEYRRLHNKHENSLELSDKINKSKEAVQELNHRLEDLVRKEFYGYDSFQNDDQDEGEDNGRSINYYKSKCKILNTENKLLKQRLASLQERIAVVVEDGVVDANNQNRSGSVDGDGSNGNDDDPVEDDDIEMKNNNNNNNLHEQDQGMSFILLS